MSSCDRRSFLSLLASVPLAACGFAPVYGTGGSGEGLRGAVLMDAPTTQDTFELAQQVEARLGLPAAPVFGLSITPRVREESLAVEGTRDITRFNLIGEADYTLRRLGTETVLLSGTVDSFTSYSATGTTVSTLTAERDARTRLMITLANLVVTRILADADQLSL